MGNGAGAVCQFRQALLVPGDGVDGQAALGEPFGDGGTHTGGCAGDEGCGVVGKRHQVSSKELGGRAPGTGCANVLWVCWR